MTPTQFWRIGKSVANCYRQMPTDLQPLGTLRPNAGDGVILGDLDESARVILVSFVGVVERVIEGTDVMQVNWRSSHFVLEPSPQGARYWGDRDTFRFDDEVADRYGLHDCLSEAFGTTEWRSERRRMPNDD